MRVFNDLRFVARFLDDRKEQTLILLRTDGVAHRLTVLLSPLRMFADLPIDKFYPLKLQLARP